MANLTIAMLADSASKKVLSLIDAATNGVWALKGVNTQTLGSGDKIADLSVASTAEGAVADAAVITDTTGTISGKLRGMVKWAFERMPASLGQKAMTASLPVVLSSDQSAVPVKSVVTQVEVTPTLTVHSGYAINDHVGTSGTAMEFANLTTVSGGAIRLEAARLLDLAMYSATFELWLFTYNISVNNDSAKWGVSDIAMGYCEYVVQFNQWFTCDNVSHQNGVSLAKPEVVIKLAAGTTSLWGALVLRSTPAGDWNTGDLKVRLTVSDA